MGIVRAFTAHPMSLGESYVVHFSRAAHFSGRLLLAGAAGLAHAFCPFLFVSTASSTVKALAHTLESRGLAAPRDSTGPATTAIGRE